MNEQLPQLARSEEDSERLYQKLVALWKRMRFYPEYGANGEIIGGETVIAEVVENTAGESKKELLSKT